VRAVACTVAHGPVAQVGLAWWVSGWLVVPLDLGDE
jgi:hypothetical protein